MLKKCLSRFVLATLIAFAYGGIIANSVAAGITPQISNEREIKVTATLQSIPNGAKTWDFALVLESHTQDLSDDLLKSSVLIADGKQYLPLSWAGAPPGGHHRKGWLRFKAIAPQPDSMELQLRLSGDTSPRSFKWLLK